jgi:hypothetical protein
VWLEFAGDGLLDITLDELGDDVLRFHVDRCAYADEYAARGAVDAGTAFSCMRDEPFAEALVPGVHIVRSETILQGARRCEFTFTLEPS